MIVMGIIGICIGECGGIGEDIGDPCAGMVMVLGEPWGGGGGAPDRGELCGGGANMGKGGENGRGRYVCGYWGSGVGEGVPGVVGESEDDSGAGAGPGDGCPEDTDSDVDWAGGWAGPGVGGGCP
jgi:hypothetical protein